MSHTRTAQQEINVNYINPNEEIPKKQLKASIE